jgi:hypothetical protein
MRSDLLSLRPLHITGTLAVIKKHNRLTIKLIEFEKQNED